LSYTNSTSAVTLKRTIINNGYTFWSATKSWNMGGGTFQNNGYFEADISSNVSLSYDGGTNAFNNAGTFKTIGSGTISVDPGVGGSNAVLPFNNSGEVDVQAGTLRLLTGGTHSGDFTGATGATLEFAGTHSFSAGSDIIGGLNVIFSPNVSSSITDNGPINITGTLTLTGQGTKTLNESVLVNAMNMTQGTTVINGDLTATSGSAQVSAGVLKGVGTLQADLQNSGIVAPGNSPGLLTVSGNYTQNSAGKLQIEIGGYNRGTQYDAFLIMGNANLNGALIVSLTGGFSPAAGDQFDILDWGSRNGIFTTVELPALSGSMLWDMSQLYTTGIISVVPEPTAAILLLLGVTGFASPIRRFRSIRAAKKR